MEPLSRFVVLLHIGICAGSDQGESMFELQGSGIFKLMTIADAANLRFPPEVIGVVSDAELKVSRFDETARFLHYKRALRRGLVITEAICSMRIAGNEVYHQDLLNEELNRSLLQEDTEPVFIERLRPRLTDARTLKETLSLANMIHRVHKTVNENGCITRDFLLETHKSLCIEAGISEYGLRKRPLAPIPVEGGYYYPPNPEEIPALLDQIIAFCNSDFCSPTYIAAIAHFYLELIVPFEWGMDRVGRLLAHMIYSRQKMWSNLVFPIGALPAIATKQHAISLFPYMTDHMVDPFDVQPLLNNWIVYCGQAMGLGAHLAKIYLDRIESMERKWTQQLGKTRKGAAIRCVLDVLPTAPMFNVPFMAELSEMSFTSVNKSVKQLADAGIIRQVSRGSRNRVFEAPDVFDFYIWVEEQILPRKINAREVFLTTLSS